jgi:hypothetical protein
MLCLRFIDVMLVTATASPALMGTGDPRTRRLGITGRIADPPVF